MASKTGSPAIRAEQERLRAEGFYSGPIDGVEGEATRMARAAAGQAADAKTAKAASDKAAADKAASDAKAAEAAARVAEANVKAAETKAKAAEASRGYDTAITAVTYTGGVAGGLATAYVLDKKIAGGIANKNLQLASAAKALSPLLKTFDGIQGTSQKASAARSIVSNRMASVVAAADNVGATKAGRGLAGPLAAGLMLAMGAGARVMGARSDNETQKTILNAFGTGEMVAGAMVAVKDSMSRAAPTSTLNIKDLAVVEQARATASPATAKAAAAATNKAGNKAAAKAGAASVAKAAGKTALKAIAPLAAIAAAAFAFRSSAQAGDSKVLAGAKAAGAAADSFTFGLGGMAATAAGVEFAKDGQKMRANPGRSAAGGDKSTAQRTVEAAIGAGGLFIGYQFLKDASKGASVIGRMGMRAAGAASMVVGAAALMSAASGGAKADDGKTQSRSAPAPASSADEARVRSIFNGIAVGNTFVAGVLAATAKTKAGRAGWAALALVNAGAASGVFRGEAPKKSSISSARQTMARIDAMRAGVQQRRSDTPATSKHASAGPQKGQGRQRQAAMPKVSDGFAEGYTRVRNGRTEQVQGYHIQPRRV